MPTILIRKIHRNGEGLRIPIPRYVCEALAWHNHDYLSFTINANDTVTLTRVNLAPIHATPIQEPSCDTNESHSTKSPGQLTLTA
jgi:hypothetical protein